MQHMASGSMGLLVPLIISLLWIAGGGGQHASFAIAAAPNSVTPMMYWEVVLPGIQMPPAISDLLAQRNVIIREDHDVTTSANNLKFVKGLRKMGPNNEKVVLETDRVEHDHITPVVEDDFKEISISYGSQGQEDVEKGIMSHKPKVHKNLKGKSMSHESLVKEEVEKTFITQKPKTEENLKEISVSYGLERETYTRKVTPNLKQVVDTYRAKNHENLREVSVSYGSKGGEDLKEISVSYGLEGEKDLKEITMSYGVEGNDILKEISMSSKVEGGDSVKERSLSYGIEQNKNPVEFMTSYGKQQGNIKEISMSYGVEGGEGVKEVSMSYGVEGGEGVKEISMSYGTEQDKNPMEVKTLSGKEQGNLKEISMSYGVEGGEGVKEISMAYGIEHNKNPMEVMASYGKEQGNLKEISVSYGVEGGEGVKEVSMSYGVEGGEGVKEISMSYGTEQDKNPMEVKTLSGNEQGNLKEISMSYGVEGGEGVKEISMAYGIEHNKNPMEVMASYGKEQGNLKEISVSYGSDEGKYGNNEVLNQGEEDPHKLTMSYSSEHEEHPKKVSTTHGTPKEEEQRHHAHAHNHNNRRQQADVFFFQDMLRPGSIITPTIPPTTSLPVLLPRHIASSNPFSTKRLSEIISMFAPASLRMTREIRWTLETCEHPRTLPGQKAGCATSLESLAELPTSLLGTHNIHAFSAANLPVEAPGTRALRGRYNVTAVRKLSGQSSEIVTCHDLTYPYAVYYCHTANPTAAYTVSLASVEATGEPTMMEALVVCHLDTSKWSPNNPFFELHNIKPGEVTVCHFLTKLSIIWVPGSEQGDTHAMAQ